ncbi:transcription factor E2F4-like [Cheilinus undulatus]|uniref:transcription factor E2F4-like n=1 Tax=Cheilinus undulatus TaxID=241271 RepID=UPI001BD26201|nr:transcription factor E2F4-like [Cheilinus undulatus]XP_041638589.1 transcription factor E2F4-like [Cheilinus undulatus]
MELPEQLRSQLFNSRGADYQQRWSMTENTSRRLDLHGLLNFLDTISVNREQRLHCSMNLDSSPPSPQGETVLPENSILYQRSLRSLRLLATKFVKMLQEAENGEVDLKDAIDQLAIGKKRRIYDITNVLEGVGLIVKISKSIVKWKGSFPGEDSPEFDSRLMELKSDLEDLEQKEHTLDQQKFWVEQSIRNTKEDCSHLTYVNHDDIYIAFTGHTLLSVQAPRGTQLDVPIPKAVPNSPAKYQIHLKSINGPIDVVLLNKSSESSDPLVLPVPPSEEILQKGISVKPTSNDTGSGISSFQASDHVTRSTEPTCPALEDLRRLLSSSLENNEPQQKADSSELLNLSKELGKLLHPNKEKMRENFLAQLMSSEVYAPPLGLSSPPSELDCRFNLDESLSDLFDIPLLNT